jgi:hypothetical protein
MPAEAKLAFAKARERPHDGVVNDNVKHFEKAKRAAQRAQHLLAQPARLDAYDWGLVAALVVEADRELQLALEHDASIQLPLLQTVLDELREATSDCTNPAFVRASKAARRQKPDLFAVRR